MRSRTAPPAYAFKGTCFLYTTRTLPHSWWDSNPLLPLLLDYSWRGTWDLNPPITCADNAERTPSSLVPLHEESRWSPTWELNPEDLVFETRMFAKLHQSAMVGTERFELSLSRF